MKFSDKKLIAIVGHYGSGKTNIALEIAHIKKARGAEKVVVADLDIVNPYFRAVDAKDLLAKEGIEIKSSQFANSNLDIPALAADIESAFTCGYDAILDIGGDDAGAVVLGKYKKYFDTTDYELLYVVSERRLLTKDPKDAAEVLRDIENACGIKATGIINNTNLGCETTAEIVEHSALYANEVAALCGLPLVATFALPEVAEKLKHTENVIPLTLRTKRYFE